MLIKAHIGMTEDCHPAVRCSAVEILGMWGLTEPSGGPCDCAIIRCMRDACPQVRAAAFDATFQCQSSAKAKSSGKRKTKSKA